MSEESREKLTGSPFAKMSEWKEARARAVTEIWSDLMPALVMDEEVLKNPVVAQYMQKYWKTPWTGGPEGNPDNNAQGLISYFIGENGVPSYRISTKLLDSYKDQNLIEGLVRAGFSVFTDRWMNFMRMGARGIVSPSKQEAKKEQLPQKKQIQVKKRIKK